MTSPNFESRTARLDLPLLFAGQAQKELFINESLARIDALLHCAIKGEAAAPPAAPTNGDCWLVGAAPSGAWGGKAGSLALYESGNWLFQPPRDGMRVFDRSTGAERRFAGTWTAPTAPTKPSGGICIDLEARSAINALIDSLVSAGVLRST